MCVIVHCSLIQFFRFFWKVTGDVLLGQDVLFLIWMNGAVTTVKISSSCPIIWVRRYSWWSYSSMMHCLLCCLLHPWLVIWVRRYSWWSYSSMMHCLLCCLLHPWLVIWVRRYSWWSYSSMLPCLLCCLLRPWLVPSSGVVSIADDLIPPCCPVCCVVFFIPGLSRHLGSPV